MTRPAMLHRFLCRTPLVVLALPLVLALAGCDALGIGWEPPPPRESGPQPVRVSQTFFTEPTEYTPAASDAPLSFALSAGVRDSRPTVVLSGRYNLPARYRARYGDDPRHGMVVVAINTEAQRVMVSPLNVLDDMSNPPGDAAADAGSGEPLTGTFGVDLPPALGMPELSAAYQFFLWCDEFVTERQSYIVPDNETERVRRDIVPITGSALLLERTEEPMEPPGITVARRALVEPPNEGETDGDEAGNDDDAPSAEGEAGAEDEEPPASPMANPRGTVIEGMVAHTHNPDTPIPMLLIALEKPTMTFGYARITLPPDDDLPRFHWDMDARHLFSEHEPVGRIWVLGIMDTAVATPISFTPLAAPAAATAE